jgi:hypothetical protein
VIHEKEIGEYPHRLPTLQLFIQEVKGTLSWHANPPCRMAGCLDYNGYSDDDSSSSADDPASDSVQSLDVKAFQGLASIAAFRCEVNAGRYFKTTLTKIVIKRDDSS